MTLKGLPVHYMLSTDLPRKGVAGSTGASGASPATPLSTIPGRAVDLIVQWAWSRVAITISISNLITIPTPRGPKIGRRWPKIGPKAAQDRPR